MEGLGDLIKEITDKTGITKIVAMTGKECDCDKRQEKLNKKFPFKKKKDA